MLRMGENFIICKSLSVQIRVSHDLFAVLTRILLRRINRHDFKPVNNLFISDKTLQTMFRCLFLLSLMHQNNASVLLTKCSTIEEVA